MTEDTVSQETMSIREMCDVFNVTPRTLRFYEAKELLAPIRKGQRRLFTNRDRARLKLILEAKDYGFPLEQIRQVLDLYDQKNGPERQLAMAVGMGRKRLVELEDERARLDSAIASLSDRVAQAESSLPFRRQAHAAA